MLLCYQQKIPELYFRKGTGEVMKQQDLCWVDTKGNKWSVKDYSESEASKCSKTLINCHNCYNCSKCTNCYDCDTCYNCENSYCLYHCRCCYDCHFCHHCTACHDMHDCHHCFACFDIHNCHSYNEQPQIYATGKIGSRNDITRFYFGKTSEHKISLQVACGCFSGDLKKFEQAVLETHAKNEVYKNQYLKEIQKVKILFELH